MIRYLITMSPPRLCTPRKQLTHGIRLYLTTEQINMLIITQNSLLSIHHHQSVLLSKDEYPVL